MRPSLFHLVRTPPQWLRACLASLMLVLALDSLAHAQHSHGDNGDGRPGVETALCGFCISFDRMADGPAPLVFAVAPADHVAHTLQPDVAPPVVPPCFRYVPRGPPAA